MNGESHDKKPPSRHSIVQQDVLLEGLTDFVAHFDNERAFSPVSSEPASQVVSARASPKRLDTVSASMPAKGKRARAGSFDSASSSSDGTWREGSDTDASSPRTSKRRSTLSRQYNAEEASIKSSGSQTHQSPSALFGTNIISPYVADFHRACQFGHISTLEQMLRKGEFSDVDIRDDENNTGLHEAAVNGQWEVIRLLLKKGASPKIKNIAGKTSIELAQTASLASFMREFQKRTEWANRIEPIKAVWKDDLLGLRKICREGGKLEDLLNRSDDLGFTAIHAAALFDRADHLRLLLNNGGDVNRSSNSGITPLHEACRWSSQESIRILTESGADLHAKNSFGFTPFSMANKSLRRFIRRLARERSISLDSMTEDVPFVHFEDISDWSQDEDDEAEDTTLNVDESLPMFGRSAGLSREERKLQQMLAIMSKISPVKAAPLSTRKSKSAESVPKVSSFDDESFELTTERRARQASMKSSTLDPKYRDTYGSTQLHKFASKGKLREVRQLLQAAPSMVSAVDNAGYSALHEAALNGHLPVVKVLLESGADIDLASSNGDTALHDAAENGHEEVVLYLLHAGANRIARNAKGKTADEVASDDRVRLLIKSPALVEVPSKLATGMDARSKALKKTSPKEPSKAESEKPKKIMKAPKEKAKKEVPISIESTPPKPVMSPKPIEGAESHGPLLLVSVGEPHGWFFLSPQMDGLYKAGMASKTADLKSDHTDLFTLTLTETQRFHLLASPLMKRLPELRESLSEPLASEQSFYLLDKDGVYAAFASHGLTFGNISVIYMDLQRMLRSSISSSTVSPPLQPATTMVPPKMKMKMARKGSGAGLSAETSPAMPAVEFSEETDRIRSNSADDVCIHVGAPFSATMSPDAKEDQA